MGMQPAHGLLQILYLCREMIVGCKTVADIQHREAGFGVALRGLCDIGA